MQGRIQRRPYEALAVAAQVRRPRNDVRRSHPDKIDKGYRSIILIAPYTAPDHQSGAEAAGAN
jgi:hypothetical protein